MSSVVSKQKQTSTAVFSHQNIFINPFRDGRCDDKPHKNIELYVTGHSTSARPTNYLRRILKSQCTYGSGEYMCVCVPVAHSCETFLAEICSTRDIRVNESKDKIKRTSLVLKIYIFWVFINHDLRTYIYISYSIFIYTFPLIFFFSWFLFFLVFLFVFQNQIQFSLNACYAIGWVLLCQSNK